MRALLRKETAQVWRRAELELAELGLAELGLAELGLAELGQVLVLSSRLRAPLIWSNRLGT